MMKVRVQLPWNLLIYDNETVAVVFANGISPDGYSLEIELDDGSSRGTWNDWATTPHFYKNTIIIYFGTSEEMIFLFEQLFGVQFAGG